MSYTFDSIKDTYFQLQNNITLMDVMLQFEKVLEESGIYAYKNWEDGEVVFGPRIEKYWVSVGLMYDYDDMPDPEGGLRLKKLGCEVYFEKNKFKVMSRVLGPNDVANPATRTPNSEIKDIWVVKIVMPRRLINIGIDKFVELDNAEVDLDYAEETGQKISNDNAQQFQAP